MRDEAQGHDLLDGLVRRAILAQADAVVREDKHRREMAQRRHAHRRAHVVGEDEEGGAIGDQATVRRQAVDNGPHRVLAHAEAQVAACVVPCPEVLTQVEIRPGGRIQVGSPADQPRQVRGQRVEHLARRDARGDGRARREDGQIGVPAVRQRAGEHGRPLRRLVRLRLLPRREHLLPGRLRRRAARDGLAEVGQHVVGNEERRLHWPAEILLGQGHFFRAERRTVHVRSPGLVGAAIADHGPDHDQ